MMSFPPKFVCCDFLQGTCTGATGSSCQFGFLHDDKTARPCQNGEKCSHYKRNWESDSCSSTCRRCDASFSLFNRRHHCRGDCGKLVCSNCLVDLPPLGKVCILCDKTLRSQPLAVQQQQQQQQQQPSPSAAAVPADLDERLDALNPENTVFADLADRVLALRSTSSSSQQQNQQQQHSVLIKSGPTTKNGFDQDLASGIEEIDKQINRLHLDDAQEAAERVRKIDSRLKIYTSSLLHLRREIRESSSDNQQQLAKNADAHDANLKMLKERMKSIKDAMQARAAGGGGGGGGGDAAATASEEEQRIQRMSQNAEEFAAAAERGGAGGLSEMTEFGKRRCRLYVSMRSVYGRILELDDKKKKKQQQQSGAGEKVDASDDVLLRGTIRKDVNALETVTLEAKRWAKEEDRREEYEAMVVDIKTVQKLWCDVCYGKEEDESFTDALLK